MAERLKRAAAWLGLVTDDRYGEYEADDVERTEGLSREELMGSQERPAAAGGARGAAAASGGGSVTTLQSKRPTSVATVLREVPLRWFPSPPRAWASRPRCSVSSAPMPRSRTALSISFKKPSLPVNSNPRERVSAST